ncbi:LacI family DNA-binding transcriptional regulator (plasmid) [Arthrobacter sp. D3-18]
MNASQSSLQNVDGALRADVTMRDVAQAAGVSMATVSNVINRPHLVAPKTRERVQRIVQERDFRRDAHAQALRGYEPASRKEQPNSRPDNVPEDHPVISDPCVTSTATPSPDPAPLELSADPLVPGQHLSFNVGLERLNGTVDVVMPDRSCFWIWTDDGMGRRMIESCEATIITHMGDQSH